MFFILVCGKGEFLYLCLFFDDWIFSFRNIYGLLLIFYGRKKNEWMIKNEWFWKNYEMKWNKMKWLKWKWNVMKGF